MPCLSKRLKFLSSEGPVDFYQCKDCGNKLRYHTVPLDSHGSQAEYKARMFEGVHPGQVPLPNIGPYKISKKLI